MIKKKEPDAIINVGGKEFRLYKYYDDATQQEILNYPDFDESPEYTEGGRPFRLAVQESCRYGKDDKDPANPDPGDCGGCSLFHRDEPFAPIGICVCEELRLTEIQIKSKKEKEQDEKNI